MSLTFAYTLLPVIADGGLGGPILVAVGGVVVIIAILLVFVMVLRSNGDARKTSSGIGYDAHQGPFGQSRAPASQPNRSRQAAPPWADEYSGQRGPASRPNAGPSGADWGGYGSQGGPASANGGRGSGAEWAPQNGGGWGGGQPAGSPWGGQQDPGGQPQWGGQQPQQPVSPRSQQNAWGEPAQGGWNQQPDPQQGWNAPPTSPRGWDQPPAQGGQNQNWNNAPSNPPSVGQDWGAPAPAGAYGHNDYGGGATEDQRTYVVRPQTGQGEPKLVVSEGKEPGRNYDIRKDRITIGRSRESDVFLEDLAVSRTHTTINRQSNGRYLLRDESSANGTLVNGQRVTEQLLEDGDKIQVGQTLLVFVYR
jgi:pSer/pThr/pTyr-binding forkhead associated (FHA) protein